MMTASGFVGLTGVSVLLADDDPSALELVQGFLREDGATVEVAATAAEALAAYERARPDVMILDIGMPDMDGYMLLREVRRRENANGWGLTPALALTGFGGVANILRAGDAGFQRYVCKPFRPEHLVRVVADLAGRPQPGRPRTNPS